LERNRYFVQVSRMDPRTGKRKFKRRWVKGSHAKAVEARKQALADLEAEIAGVVAEEPITLADYVEQWLEARSGKLKPSTKAKYLNDLEKHILPKLGHMMISEIRPRDIEAMLGKDRGAPNSKKNRLTLLRAVAKDALANEVTERDFCARVTVSVPPVYTVDEPNLLSGEQTARVLEVIPRYWLDLVCVLSYTGLRWGEVTGLHWRDVQIDAERNRGKLVVRCNNWKGQLLTPKSTKGLRLVPLVAPLPQLLAERHERMRAEGHPGLRKGLVFPTRSGELHRGTPLRKVLLQACEKVGIEIRFTTHGLRRTWNNIARRYAEGMVVRAIIGHADEAMTELYSMVDTDEKHEVAEAVAEHLKPHVTVSVTVGPDQAPSDDLKPQ